VRAPLLHFLILGALLFIGQRWFFPQVEPPPAPITLSEESAERIRREWLARSGRLPDAREWQALRREALNDELLYREALALGLHENDALVARRLIRNMRFLAEGEDEDREETGPPSRARDAELYREALALKMHESDLVVRRRLVQTMTLGVYAAARTPEPTEEELEAYLASHPDAFRVPEQVRITQVFLSGERRGSALEADAAALLERLRAEASQGELLANPALGQLGDPLPLPTEVPMRSEAQLVRTFGGDFASAVMGIPQGSWQGPIASSYGFHCVWLHERIAARVPTLGELRRQVLDAVQRERGEQALGALLASLRERYGVQE
jgi:hypothetical protein